MAKSDAVLARIDADIARLKDIDSFVQQRSTDKELIDGINNDIAELLKMRAYLTQTEVAAKVKQTRKKRSKPGLPAADTASL